MAREPESPWHAGQDDWYGRPRKLTSDGMTIAEVAEALGLSETRVVQIERAAMDKIRRYFGLHELIKPNRNRTSRAGWRKRKAEKESK
jgi:transcriptional regulator with XRE-family HTH domain